MVHACGPGLEKQPPYLNIGGLRDFVFGYLSAGGRDEGFFAWLRDTADAFPANGWQAHHLRLANGDHQKAIELFFARLHEWIEETRPAWFLEFNRLPRESQIRNGLGTPRHTDVRLAKHIELADAGPPPGPALHLEGTAFDGSSTWPLGMPPGFAAWWTPAARRVVLTDSAESTARFARHTGPLDEQLATLRFGVVVDVSRAEVSIRAHGGAGVVHLRDRKLLAKVSSGTTDALGAGDRLLLLSPVLFAAVREPLPSKLAPGHALTWAQLIDSAEPRLCVALSTVESVS